MREMPPYGDMLVCGISTQLGQQVVGFDEVISLRDADFFSSGLVATSLIRLGYLTVIPQQRVVGAIGVVSTERYKRLVTRLSQYLAEHI